MSKEDGVAAVGYRHVVCLLDVLGQKQKLARWANLPDDGQITPEFIHAMEETAGTATTLRDQFMSLFARLADTRVPDILATLPQQSHAQYLRIKDCEVKVERFSDTFVFSSQIPNPHGDLSITPVARVLGACCFAMIVSLAAKVPVRGAVTVGAGKVLEDNSFYGPALAEAHHLESEVAGWPRVIVSPNVYSFLTESRPYSKDPQIAKVMHTLADSSRAMIWRDVDGCWAVDFLGEWVRGTGEVPPPIANTVTLAYDFVREQATHFRQSGNAKLAMRYHLLRQYMESRLPLWGLKADP